MELQYEKIPEYVPPTDIRISTITVMVYIHRDVIFNEFFEYIPTVKYGEVGITKMKLFEKMLKKSLALAYPRAFMHPRRRRRCQRRERDCGTLWAACARQRLKQTDRTARARARRVAHGHGPCAMACRGVQATARGAARDGSGAGRGRTRHTGQLSAEGR